MKNRFLIVALAIILCLTFVACSDTSQSEETVDLSTIDFELIKEQLPEYAKEKDDEALKSLTSAGFMIEEDFEGSGEPILFVAATTSDTDCEEKDLYIIAGTLFKYINDLAAEQNPDIALSSDDSFGGLYKSIKCGARVATDSEAMYGLAINVDLFSPEDEKNLISIMNQ